MTLGVFDSGIGGEAVSASLRSAFPSAAIHTVSDREHVPYGDREPQEIITLTNAAIQPLLEQNCDIIIIACNTATASAIEWLRQTYPHQLFIGLEPMIKPAAALTKTGVIAVCATPATLASQQYLGLKTPYIDTVTLLEPDCRNWARMIEDDSVHEHEIEATITSLCDSKADVIVLACTHYHWIREVIEKSAAGRATVIDPSEAIARRVESLLQPR